jgi:hypothetical protein
MPRQPDQIADLRRELAAQAARLVAVERALAERSALAPLKRAAAEAGVEYEAARRLCARSLVSSRKVGGRIFACPGDLVLHARRNV